MIITARKFICIPISIASVRLFSPDCNEEKTRADSIVMITKVIQNPGFESCLMARLYLIVSNITTGITTMSHHIQGSRLTTSSMPATSRMSAASHARE